jgi:hypothetical protein
MRRHASAFLWLCLVGCASKTKPEATPSPSINLGGGCAEVARTPPPSSALAELPLVVPQDRPQLPIPRSRPTREIRTRFMVDPSGRAVRTSIVITGTGEPEFRQQMEDAVMRIQFPPAEVGGCRTWGRGDFRLRAR